MKSRELLRQLVECHFWEEGVGTYTTGNYSTDCWGMLLDYFKAERIKGELKADTEYLYYYSSNGVGIVGVQDEIVLKNEWGRIFLYEM